jgi:hypothetical protein
VAISHIQFDARNSGNVTHGLALRTALSQLEQGRENLIKIRDTMALMVDGDTGTAANYGEVVTRFGFGSTTDAKAAFDEINSALGKITTDASVSSVQAALLQLFNKLR